MHREVLAKPQFFRPVTTDSELPTMTNRAIWSFWSVFACAFEAQAREVSLEYRRFSLPSLLKFITDDAERSEEPQRGPPSDSARGRNETSDDMLLEDLVDNSQHPSEFVDLHLDTKPPSSVGSELLIECNESNGSADSLAEFIVCDAISDEQVFSIPLSQENHAFAERSDDSPKSPRAHSLSSEDSLAEFAVVDDSFDATMIGHLLDTKAIDSPTVPHRSLEDVAVHSPSLPSEALADENEFFVPRWRFVQGQAPWPRRDPPEP